MRRSTSSPCVYASFCLCVFCRDRSGDADRKKFQKQIRADLLARRIPFIPLTGTVEERVAKVKGVLARFDKWRGLGAMVL